MIMFLSTAYFLQISCSQREPTIEESISLANHNLETGNTDQAINIFEDLNDNHPGMAIILEPLAFAYAEKGDNILAAFYFTKLGEVDSAQKHYFIYAAKSFIKGGDLRGSANAYRRYLKEFPHDQAVWKSLGKTYEELKDSNNAIESYLQSYQLKPDGGTATYLGRLFHGMGNLIQAKNWYRTGLDLLFDDAEEPLLGLMKIALEQKDYSLAEEWLEKIDDEYPNLLDTSPLSSAREELRIWRERQAKLEKSLVEQNRLTEEIREQSLVFEQDINEDSSLSHSIDSHTSIDENEESDEPTEVVSDAITKELPESVITSPPVSVDNTQEVAQISATPPPPTSRSLLLEARGFKVSGDYKSAIVKYRQSLALNDREASTWNELSETLKLDGQLRYAEATSLEAMRRDTLNITYTQQLLNILSQDENLFRYFRELKNAKERFPSSPEITLSLARGYNNIVNNTHNAIISYEEFLQMAPDHPQWQKANIEFKSLSPTP